MFGWIKKLVGKGEQAPLDAVAGADHHVEGERRLTEEEWWNEPAGPPPPTVGEVFGAELRGGGQPPATPSVPAGLLPPGNEEFRRQRIADAMKNDPAAKYMRGPALR